MALLGSVGPSGRKLIHPRCGIEGDIGSFISLLLLLAFMKETFLTHMSPARM